MKKKLPLFLLLLCPIFVFSQNIEVAGGLIANSINVNEGIISNVANPISAQDAATKSYVDLLKAQLATLQGVKDIDNNRYEIVAIGTQMWMAENLKTTRYNDGTVIPLIPDISDWCIASTNGNPAYTWSGNETGNETEGLMKYGALYNWYAIDGSSNEGKNVCPIGWHVPTDGEWTTLSTFWGEESVAGGKMKEAGLAHWTSPNTGATNDSGFAGLPGGHQTAYCGASSYDVGVFGYWWSSTEKYSLGAWYRVLAHDNGVVGRNANAEYGKGFGFSVRCLRDD